MQMQKQNPCTLQYIPVYGVDVYFSMGGSSLDNVVEKALVLAGFMVCAPKDSSHKEKETQGQQSINNKHIVATFA